MLRQHEIARFGPINLLLASRRQQTAEKDPRLGHIFSAQFTIHPSRKAALFSVGVYESEGPPPEIPLKQDRVGR